MNRRRRVTVATGAVTAAAVVAVLPVLAANPVPAQTTSDCSILEVTGSGSGTHLLQRLLPSDQATTLRTLPGSVNAIAAAAAHVYGVNQHGHVVTLDRSGQEADLGLPTGHDPHALTGATGGTVVGDRWYVRAGSTLYQVDVDPDSHAYLRITGAVTLRPASLAADLDDLDARPGTGSLYGVAQPNRWHGVVVRVDPLSGWIIPVRGDLPGGRSYGAVSFGPDGALYARQNDIEGRSVRYRIPLHGGFPRVLDTQRPVTWSDATGCLPAPPPPPPATTTTTVPPTTRTTVPATTPATPTTAMVLQAVIPPHTTTVRPTTRPPVTPPPPTPPPAVLAAPVPPTTVAIPDDPLPRSATLPVADVAERTKERRWGLTVLIVIIGGAAAASRMRPSRRAGS